MQAHDHDHSHTTHSAGCDESRCNYVAEVHAHDDNMAVKALSHNLAQHNQSEHDLDTKAEEIEDDVRDKMKIHNQ